MKPTLAQIKYAATNYVAVGESVRDAVKNDQVKYVVLPGIDNYYDIEHVQGFFSTDNEGIRYVYFIGSNEAADWVHNLAFPAREIPYNGTNSAIKVHTGFLASYKQVRSFIHKSIAKYSKVIIYGHSLGGAIATLCAVDINYNFPGTDIGVITTGSPKVGNNAFISSYNRRIPDTVRIVNGRDIVPSIPPDICGFKHVSSETLIGSARKHPLSIKDHLAHNYLREISKLTWVNTLT